MSKKKSKKSKKPKTGPNKPALPVCEHTTLCELCLAVKHDSFCRRMDTLNCYRDCCGRRHAAVERALAAGEDMKEFFRTFIMPTRLKKFGGYIED